MEFGTEVKTHNYIDMEMAEGTIYLQLSKKAQLMPTPHACSSISAFSVVLTAIQLLIVSSSMGLHGCSVIPTLHKQCSCLTAWRLLHAAAQCLSMQDSRNLGLSRLLLECSVYIDVDLSITKSSVLLHVCTFDTVVTMVTIIPQTRKVTFQHLKENEKLL